MLLLFSVRELNDHLFGKDLSIPFIVRVFRGRLSNLCASFIPFFGVEGGMCVVLIPDHCFTIYFTKKCLI